MKTVDLEEILEKNDVTMYSRFHDYETHYDNVLNAMKEACKQTLELAAENADIHIPEGAYYDIYVNPDMIEIDNQSILDTLNQVKP